MKRRAIAIAIVRPEPFSLAAESAANFFAMLIDIMYGTPKRTRMTLLFAFALLALGYFMQDAQALQSCAS